VTDDRLQSERCAEKLKALGDPTRLKIIDVLRAGQMSVGEIAVAVDQEIVLVSHHLGVLHQAALVDRQKRGRYVYYRLKEGLLSTAESATDHLDLGCCRLEVPASEKLKDNSLTNLAVPEQKKRSR
jgi:DNA-binding transcriptional ArsR family regulator